MVWIKYSLCEAKHPINWRFCFKRKLLKVKEFLVLARLTKIFSVCTWFVHRFSHSQLKKKAKVKCYVCVSTHETKVMNILQISQFLHFCIFKSYKSLKSIVPKF